MCALRTRQDHILDGWRNGSGRRHAHFEALVPHELHAGTPMFFPAPISPEDRGRTNLEPMQQHAHLARLCRRSAIPLTLVAQRTRTTTANAGSIHNTQTAIDLSALLMRDQHAPSRAPQGSIRLEREVGTCKTASFPGGGRGRWSIPRGRS